MAISTARTTVYEAEPDDLPTASVQLPPRTIPVWAVPAQAMFTETEDLPGWRSVDLRNYSVGTRLLDRYGVIQEVQREDGYLQKRWSPIGGVVPRDWEWVPLDGWQDHVTAIQAANGKQLHARAGHLAALATFWSDETYTARERKADREDFFDELAVQLHRPAPIRKAVVKITKTTTRRGRVSLTNADPMTPWALRLAAERLVTDIAADGDGQAADVTLKRFMNLSARAEELQTQLDEVAGHLAACDAMLRGQA